MSVHIVIMGVAGCGKTSVATEISKRMGFVMAEGDDLHPRSNIEKMLSGVPLDDNDRWPWLRTISKWMREQDQLGHDTVVSCSSLKRSYRDILRAYVNVFFVHLTDTPDEIYARMESRAGHFMPPALLDSQFDILEPLQSDEQGVTINVEASLDSVTEQAIEAIVGYQMRVGNMVRA